MIMKRVLLTSLFTLGLLTGCATTPGGKGLFVHPAVVTTNIASGVITTNLASEYILNPGIANTIGTAQDVITNAPFPWSGALAGILGLLSGSLALVAKIKSNKAAILPAIIAGIEAAGNAEVKKAVLAEATAAGVETLLHKEVRRITG